MEKSVSSPKILNIVLCIMILLAFCIIGTRINVHASESAPYEETIVPITQD